VSYEVLSKGLVMVAAVYMVTSLLVFGYHTQSRQALQEINSMSSNLNDAEKPVQAFQTLTEEVNTSDSYNLGVEAFGEKVEGQTFAARMKLSGKVLYDMASTEAIVYQNFPWDSEEDSLGTEGLYLESCPDSYSYEELCDETGTPKAVNYWASWMTLAQEAGTVDQLRQNTSTWNEMRDYLKRAQYYDTRLTDFQIRPLQVAYYTDTGLYIVGRGEERIEVNGETYMLEDEDPLRYVDIELDNGSHILKRGNHRILLEVGPDIPDHGITSDRKLAIRNRTGPYTAVRLDGESTTTKQLKEQNHTVIDIPADMERGHYQPFRATFISKQYNQTITLGEPYPGINDRMLYFYGMSPDEYRRTQEIFNRTNIDNRITIH
jgi:hypothetical protein